MKTKTMTLGMLVAMISTSTVMAADYTCKGVKASKGAVATLKIVGGKATFKDTTNNLTAIGKDQ